jgi:hypothetical protein
MLEALLAVSLPDYFVSLRRDRYNALLDRTFRDVTISPRRVHVSTLTFGTPGAYAHIALDEGGTTYTVGVFATDMAYQIQSAGHVIHFASAPDAVRCALEELRSELLRQGRGR